MIRQISFPMDTGYGDDTAHIKERCFGFHGVWMQRCAPMSMIFRLLWGVATSLRTYEYDFSASMGRGNIATHL